MRYPTPGQHRSVAAFRAHIQGLDPAFDCATSIQAAPDSPMARPIELFGRQLHNRYAAQPMEGWDARPDGLPSEHTLRRWRRFGHCGAQLIWGGEAFAVHGDGRANPRQLYLNPAVDMQAGLARLRAELCAGHEEFGGRSTDLVIGLQLTHSGRFSRPAGPFAPRIAVRRPLLEQRYPESAELTPLSDGELDAIGESYVTGAQLADAAGFDFVDVKCCHGYLLHELLGAHDRPGSYGGDLAGRSRLLQRIIRGIRSACPRLGIGLRVSIGDTPPFEPDPDTGTGRRIPGAATRPFGTVIDERGDPGKEESFAFLRLLHNWDIPVVNLSLGSPYYNPHLQRPSAYPPSDGYQPPIDPLAAVFSHLRMARLCRAAVPELRYVGSGYSYLQEFLPHVAEFEVGAGHVDFVGLGRMLLTYPDLPRDHLAGRPLQRKRICRTFSDCTTAPRNGMLSGCFPLDPYYKGMPEAAAVRQLRGGKR